MTQEKYQQDFDRVCNSLPYAPSIAKLVSRSLNEGKQQTTAPIDQLVEAAKYFVANTDNEEAKQMMQAFIDRTQKSLKAAINKALSKFKALDAEIDW